MDFNSWLPKNLNLITKEKIINYYLNLFKNNNNFHDKVEFKILFTCFNAETDKKLKNINKKILNDKEKKQFKKELKKLHLIQYQR